MTEDKPDDYYIPDIKKPKDISDDVDKYNGCLKEFIDSDDGSIKVKLEHDVIVERVATTIYTSWLSGIRELLTNELKACKLARDNFKANPYMVISINPIERTLIIQGFDSLGITAKRFGNIVAWLGRSHNKDRGSIGMFGMGIEAYTTLSSTLKIESNPRETPENFTVLGRDGKTWLPLEETTNIPYGCRLTMVLNKDLGGTTFFKHLVDRIKDVVALHGIPTTIYLEDEIDDDGNDYTIGNHEVELLNQEQYTLRMIDHVKAKDRYSYNTVDKSTIKSLHIDRETYDITILYGSNDGSNNNMNDDCHVFTTLIDVPINNEFNDKGSIVASKVNDLDKKGLLTHFPDFTAILINLKDEAIYPPIASRDNLKDGWIKTEMLIDCYDLACKWYDEHRVSKLDELFTMTSQDINTWHWLFQYSTDRNEEASDDRKQLTKCIDLKFNLWKDNRKKYDRVSFYDILTRTSGYDINYDHIFYMSSFFKHKMVGIDEETGETCTYVRLASNDDNVEEFNTLDYLFKKMNELCLKDDMYFYDTIAWLKDRKVKLKIRRLPKPKGSIVWHYNKVNSYSYDQSTVSDTLFYEKNRHDESSMKSTLAKKKIRLQLSNKQWGKHRLSIADIVGVLNQIPTDIMFCKADTDLNANSVDDYIKGVMSRYVFTSQGNYKMNELMDKFRDSNVEVKLVYYPYSDIINEECFGTNSNELYICAKNNDELVGLSLAFITDGYIHDKTWTIQYNDKDMVELDRYNEVAIIDLKMKKLMPKKVVELLLDKKYIARWNNAEWKGCMVLALVDLHRSIPAKFFSDMARSLTYVNSYSELGNEVKRIKELCLEEVIVDRVACDI